MTIRVARPQDAEGCSQIYTPYVTHGIASFELVPPKTEEFEARISNTLKSHPWLVAVEDDKVIAYAYAGYWRTRPAYRWGAEVSVYVAEGWHGQGIGKNLYSHILDILRKQRILNVYAGITLPNPASVRLHESMGFVQVATFPRAGFKHDKRHDVGW